MSTLLQITSSDASNGYHSSTSSCTLCFTKQLLNLLTTYIICKTLLPDSAPNTKDKTTKWNLTHTDNMLNKQHLKPARIEIDKQVTEGIEEELSS